MVLSHRLQAKTFGATNRLTYNIPMTPIHLFNHQKEMRLRLDEAFEAHQSVMVQMPTGTGKTHLLASVVDSFVQKSEETVVWIVAHRKELVAQIERTLGLFGIKTNHKRPERCQARVYSIQWLTKHIEEMADIPALIVVDEAHHVLAKTYAAVLNAYPSAYKLGMTATPCRLNGKGFGDLFEKLLRAEPINGFIKSGYLAPFDYVSIPTDSEEIEKIDGLKKRAADGDYNIAEMSEVLNTRPSIERLHETVMEFAQDKKGIVYAINIEHANNIAEYYRGKGLKAESISSKTPDGERERLVADFANGEVQILVNVEIFSEGFDCPDVEFIQMARPTISLAKYLQQVGRGLRTAEGKRCCVLLDNVGLYRLFGLPTNDWNWQALFDGRQRGCGEVQPGRVAYMRYVEMKSLKASAGNKKTEMVMLARHEDLQEDMDIMEQVSLMGDGNGIVVGKAGVNRYYRIAGKRNQGRELLQDVDGAYYTYLERRNELIRVGTRNPWMPYIDSYIKPNPYATRRMPRSGERQHTDYIWKARVMGMDDVHKFDGRYHLGRNGEMDNIYRYISKAMSGVRTFIDNRGYAGVMNQDGDYYLLWDKCYVEIDKNGVAYVKDKKNDARGRWINLYTMQEFAERPEAMRIGGVDVLKVGEACFVQKDRMMAGVAMREEEFLTKRLDYQNKFLYL